MSETSGQAHRSIARCAAHNPKCPRERRHFRTDGALPASRGRPCARTHDSTRHGTITLFAALNNLDGKLMYRTEQKQTHVEWLRFLNQIQCEAPRDVDNHLIADNYCTHKHTKVKAWLAGRKRFHMHFVPNSSS